MPPTLKRRELRAKRKKKGLSCCIISGSLLILEDAKGEGRANKEKKHNFLNERPRGGEARRGVSSSMVLIVRHEEGKSKTE